MDVAAAPAAIETGAPPPRQRWRLTLARPAGPLGPTGRDLIEAFERALDATDLPVTKVGRGASRIAFGAPLPAGMGGDGELAEIVLTERRPAWSVREALAEHLPDGWRLVDLEDVWLGSPALPAVVTAADYVVVLEDVGPSAPDASRVADAARALLDAPHLQRTRAKGGGIVEYDLRPLLIDIRLRSAGPPVVLGIAARLHPTLGTGRPEEVVAALGEVLAAPLAVRSTTRQRLRLGEAVDG